MNAGNRIDNFEQAVNFFVRAMRCRSFVEADELLHQKYGDILYHRVTTFCFENGVTIRLLNGKLSLATIYKKPTSTIIIKRERAC